MTTCRSRIGRHLVFCGAQVVMPGQEDWAVKAALVGLVAAKVASAAPEDGAEREATAAPERIVSKACRWRRGGWW